MAADPRIESILLALREVLTTPSTTGTTPTTGTSTASSYLSSITESTAAIERRNVLLKTELETLKESEEFLAKQNERLDSFIKMEEIKLQLNDKALRDAKKEVELAIESDGINTEADARNSERYQAAVRNLAVETNKYELKKKELELAKQLGDNTKKGIGDFLGVSSKWEDTSWGKLSQISKMDGGFQKGIQAIGKSFSDTFTAANIGGSLLTAVIEQTVNAFKEYDQAASSLAKVAGANEQLQSVLSNTARGATAYGISFAQAGKAIEGLYSELNTFSTLNQKAQEQIVVSTAKLEKLGISSQQSAKQIATLTQIMGMTEVQAAKTAEELAGFALAIGKSPTQVASDFAAASDKLGAYGDKMIDVFKNLETQSKGTGVALNDLLGLAEKFQTFEGAATAAGKLNAALGGGFVNAMELLEASAEDPAKVIGLLRDRLNDAGLAFDQMSFYEKKMIVDAGGFKSVDEASRILSRTNAEAERIAAADAERKNQQNLLNEAIQRSIPIQEKIQLLMSNLAIIMGPVVDFLSSLISGFTMIVDNPIGGFLVKLGVVIAMLFAGPVGIAAAAIYGLVTALQFLHDILFVPNSPILFNSLVEMGSIFPEIAGGVKDLDGAIVSTSNNFDSFAKSAKGIASSLETLPDSISVTTPQLGKLNTSMEVTNKITDATKQSVDSINNLNADKAKMLVNVMSPQQPNVTVTPTINQPAPEVKVYLGNEPIKGIVNKVINGGSNLSPQTLGVPSK